MTKLNKIATYSIPKIIETKYVARINVCYAFLAVALAAAGLAVVVSSFVEVSVLVEVSFEDLQFILKNLQLSDELFYS